MKFKAKIRQAGINITGIVVPDEVMAGLNAGKRSPVKVTINGYTYPSTIGVRNGVTLLPLSVENREAAGVAGGDIVEVNVELDTEPRVVAVPDDLAAALAKDTEAKQAYEALSYSKQKAIVGLIEQAKTDETRTRRIASTVETLRKG